MAKQEFPEQYCRQLFFRRCRPYLVRFLSLKQHACASIWSSYIKGILYHSLFTQTKILQMSTALKPVSIYNNKNLISCVFQIFLYTKCYFYFCYKGSLLKFQYRKFCELISRYFILLMFIRTLSLLHHFIWSFCKVLRRY